MIGPVKEVPHPRSLLKRKQPCSETQIQVVDIVQDVCNYETISEYIQLFSGEDQDQGGSPASLESGYQTGQDRQDDEDSNLSWLLNFKVSSLFDPSEPEERSSPQHAKREDSACVCSGTTSQRTLQGKPPFTYTELIEKALREQGGLTVSGIYNWISKKYPYYNPSDDRWKNSVRHNLSINPHFRKGVKSRQGAGHLWTLSNEGVHPPPDSWKRTKGAGLLPRSPSPTLVDEAAIAAAHIMSPEDRRPPSPLPYTMAPPPPPPAQTDPGLTRVAEEILSGVKRRVEVQYLVHDRITNEFLNPVSKEEIVSESGLETHCETSSFLTELNSDLHLPDNLFSDELAFTCYSQL